MRFLPFCLLATTTALAQQADSVKGRQRLDKQRCFGGICFGKAINSHKYNQINTHHSLDHRYSPRAEKARLYGYRVRPYLVYTKYAAGINGIEFTLADSLSSIHLLQMLQARYGPYTFEQKYAKLYKWRGHRVSLTYYIRPDNKRLGWASLRAFLLP